MNTIELKSADLSIDSTVVAQEINTVADIELSLIGGGDAAFQW